VQVIEADPVMTIKVLKVTNSSYYSFPKKITAIKDRFAHLQLLLRIDDAGDELFNEAVHIPTLSLDFPQLEKTSTLQVADRSWRVKYSAAPGFYNEQISWNVWWMILGGFLLTGMSGVGLLMLTGRTLQTEALVKIRTRELDLEIAEHRRTEALLRDKERVLSESQRIAHVGSWKVDMAGNIVWSDETYRIYGVAPETFQPGTESFYPLLHPDDRESVCAWTEDCAAEKQPGPIEFRIIRPDGVLRVVCWQGNLHVDADGRAASKLSARINPPTYAGKRIWGRTLAPRYGS
jgi:PAS domain-containing protein